MSEGSKHNFRKEQEELRKEIETLPKGGITQKRISGRLYTYYQWMENGVQRARSVHGEEEDYLREATGKRKVLEKRLKELQREEKASVKRQSSASGTIRPEYGIGLSAGDSGEMLLRPHMENVPYIFHAQVRIGDDLRRFADPVRTWKKRELFQKIRDYVYGDISDRVLILYGLRRTGKTTMVRQLIGEMPEDMFLRTAFIQVHNGCTMAEINQDIHYLEGAGFRYLFLDEVTLMEDFIEGAALFSDIFAASGMRIVLSGTDSLGFLFSEDQQLYDRCIFVHTTHIPYREFANVLGIHDMDTYIRYGGTMSQSGAHYNDPGGHGPFSTAESAGEYVDSAIAHNIQHSLKNYQHGNHFRHLQELYEKGELTSAINRVVEDLNHRFVLEVLTRDFFSEDFGISAGNLRRDRNHPTDILDHVDREQVTRRLKELMEIRNQNEQAVSLSEDHVREIEEYLELMDFIRKIPVVSLTAASFPPASFPAPEANGMKIALTQPGIRYAQARALILSLVRDPVFYDQPFAERKGVEERILSEIRGRMMEEIVLLETQEAQSQYDVFQLHFAIGEFDMVIADPVNGGCRIYEIKHSNRQVPEQMRHLLDAEKCRETEFRYGKILGKYVIYRGPSEEGGEASYLNVEQFLEGLGG